MDHILKEHLDLLEEQNNEILDNQALIMEKLGITSSDVNDEEDKEVENNLDF
jgi:hypothetical protein